MPAKTPHVSPDVASMAQKIGSQIRLRRKALGVNATAVAESAGMSRVTLYRIEHGEPSVTFGAYLAVLDVLSMAVAVGHPILENLQNSPLQPEEGWLPLSIPLVDYPQLKRLAWQISDVEKLSPREALDIYERNWRHLDVAELDERERQLIDALRAVFKEGEKRV